MANSSQWIDVSKFPEGEKPHILELAQKHNALCEDVDKISGATPEDKEAMHQLFSFIRDGIHKLHSKRFNVGLATLQIGGGLFVLDKLGVDVKALGPLINSLIKTVLSFN